MQYDLIFFKKFHQLSWIYCKIIKKADIYVYIYMS